MTSNRPTHPNPCSPLLGGAALALALLLSTAAVAAPGSSQASLQELRDTYQRVVQDPTYLQLKAALRGNLDNRDVVDRYLGYLPISPLQMLQMKMRQERFEIAVPRLIYEWHLRWQELHGQTESDLAALGSQSLAAGGQAGPGPAGALRAATVGTNRNAATDFTPPPVEYQGEIQVAVNPNDPLEIVGAANTWDDINGTCGDLGMQAVFYSSDGGDTWGYSCPPDDDAYQSIDPGLDCSALGGQTFGSDPAVYWDDSGNVYLNHMLICYNGDYFYSMVVARSTDGGATWSARGVIKNSYATGDLEDKNFYVIDNNPGSPYYGRHYTCWDRSNNEKLARSTTSGSSWTEADLPTTSGSCRGTVGRYDLACDMAVNDNGTVYAIWDTLACGVQTCKCEQMYFSRSTDGGATWTSPLQLADFNLVGFSSDSTPDPQDTRGIAPFGAVDVDNTGGACDGTLYVAYGDETGGGADTADIFVIRSTDNGASWSAPLLVNDDGPGGNCQFHPFLVVDQSTGDVVVAWHDARNDPGNDFVDYYLARSTDCGLSFEADIQVSKTSSEFNNATITWSDQNTVDNPNYNPNQYGEYLGLDAQGGKAYVAWSDTRHYFPTASGDVDNEQENMGFALVEFAQPTCGDATCDPGEDSCSCPQDCGSPPATEFGLCTDGADNDCDLLIDCLDTADCSSDPACVCVALGDPCNKDDDCCSGNCSNGPPSSRVCQP